MANDKQFLYTIIPTRLAMLTEGPTAAEEATLGQHYRHLKELTEHGIVVMAGRTQTADAHTFGIVILRADDKAAARKLMLSDPAVAHGVMHASLYPFRIALPIQ
jgi:uncharacterized protein YciI